MARALVLLSAAGLVTLTLALVQSASEVPVVFCGPTGLRPWDDPCAVHDRGVRVSAILGALFASGASCGLLLGYLLDVRRWQRVPVAYLVGGALLLGGSGLGALAFDRAESDLSPLVLVLVAAEAVAAGVTCVSGVLLSRARRSAP